VAGGKFVSFLLDPPSLVVLGILLGRFIHHRLLRLKLAAFVVLLFLFVSVLLYLDVIPWWFGGWVSGSDWMLNSGLGTDLRKEEGMGVLAVIMFAAYPLWMKLGLNLGGRGD
jgi:hypothetical protein